MFVIKFVVQEGGQRERERESEAEGAHLDFKLVCALILMRLQELHQMDIH